MINADPPALPDFLAFSGNLDALADARDWSRTPLGAPAGWPVAVRATLATWLDSPQPMCMVWGPELSFFFNAAYAPFLGARVGQALGMPFREVWPEIWSDIEPIVARALSGTGTRFEEMPLTMTRNGYPEDTWWTFTYQPLRDETGEVIGMLCTTADATAQVLGSRQAARERLRHQHLMEQMPGFAAVLSGPDHVYEYVNDAYRRVAGDRDFLGRGVRDILPELQEQGFYDLLDDAYASGQAFIARAQPIRFAGEDENRFIDLLYQPIRDETGKVTGIFVGGYDVTEGVKATIELRRLNETLEQRVDARTAELMRAQDALRQAQKLEAVGQLTGGIAHDFNNLLTVIGSSVELMRRQEVPAERRRKYMDAISETVRRASKLTGQLLAFARRQPLRPEVFDIARQIEAVADLIQPLVGARVEIALDVGRSSCLAKADVSQFGTAMMNLAVNARDAMEGEGRLAIRIDPVDELPMGPGQPARPGSYVAIAVSDDGMGIARENLEVVFEPFYTTKGVGKGTGLGLSQVFGFAQQSGGDVRVESEVGVGTTFTLYLPRAAETMVPAEPPPAAPSDVELETQGLSVLVVEDDATVGQFSTEVLHDLGYHTTWATDANRALALLAEDNLRFDLVFSDVIMPGMNGVELARAIRDRYPGLPVVLTSGYSTVLAEEGPRGFELVQKPYSVEALSRVLRQAMAKRGTLG
jgi:signal transduction histidine kinase/ActR/RegA family two-component response regulator